MKYKILILVFCSFLGFSQNLKSTTEINLALDSWHKAATEANFDNYFQLLTDDAIFIGTDAKENWTKSQFMAYSKPYFDKGKAWSFTSLERNVYFSADGKTAWFDELLNTQMKLCRGSGVFVKVKNTWKLKHYVLSMTIPNDNTNEVVSIKSTIENPIINSFLKK
jgi:ketosteroid isomerase-like protein